MNRPTCTTCQHFRPLDRQVEGQCLSPVWQADGFTHAAGTAWCPLVLPSAYCVFHVPAAKTELIRPG